MYPSLIKYYEVSDNYSDDGLRPNATQVIGRFSTEVVAKEYAKGRGNYGHDAQVREISIVICSSVDQAEKAEELEAKERALKKLTKEERILLELE